MLLGLRDTPRIVDILIPLRGALCYPPEDVVQRVLVCGRKKYGTSAKQQIALAPVAFNRIENRSCDGGRRAAKYFEKVVHVPFEIRPANANPPYLRRVKWGVVQVCLDSNVLGGRCRRWGAHFAVSLRVVIAADALERSGCAVRIVESERLARIPAEVKLRRLGCRCCSLTLWNLPQTSHHSERRQSSKHQGIDFWLGYWR